MTNLTLSTEPVMLTISEERAYQLICLFGVTPMRNAYSARAFLRVESWYSYAIVNRTHVITRDGMGLLYIQEMPRN